MFQNKKNELGLTLLEVMIALVISTIILSGSYVTYSLVSKHYTSINDRADMYYSGRKAIDAIIKDLRNAGYKDRDSKCTSINFPVKTTDGGNTNNDEIEIIYDKNKNERLKIIYKVENNKLYQITQSNKGQNCNFYISKYKQEEQVLIQGVEDLQFQGINDEGVPQTQACGQKTVEFFLTIKSKKEHGKEREYQISENQNANRELNFKDNYLRKTYSTSVTLRNVLYGGTPSCT